MGGGGSDPFFNDDAKGVTDFLFMGGGGSDPFFNDDAKLLIISAAGR